MIITDKKFLDLGGMVIKAQMFCSPNVKNESRYRDNKALLETLNDLSISMDEIHNELHQQK